MTGYVARKGDRWYAVIYEGVDLDTRKSVAGSCRQAPTPRSRGVGRAAQHRRGGASGGTTISTHCDRFLVRNWLPAKQVQLAPVTFAGYHRMIRLLVHPHIGALRRIDRGISGAACRSIFLTHAVGVWVKKGRTEFNQRDIDRVRSLLADKSRATRQRQKRIRDEIRTIGFYITDFDDVPRPFGPRDLDDLIETGRIHIS